MTLIGRNGAPDQLLMIGSVPLDTMEDVVRMFGPPLGKFLFCMPDGEVGDRRWWAQRLCFQVFNGHPELQVLQRPKADSGVERLVPRDGDDVWRFQVRDDVGEVRFGNPGWRLGFAQSALDSYVMFRMLRAAGLLPAGARFQVSVPLVNSVVTSRTFPAEGDLERVRPGYENALKAEIETIVSRIPGGDLALQWDLSHEITDVYGGIPGLQPEGAIERNVGQIRRISSVVPEEIALGFHFCFGTLGGWPRFAPDDLGAAVDLANAAVEASGRRVDWVNIPVLNTVNEGFFAPLANLRARGARVYLGAIHSMESLRERLTVAQRYLPSFGLAAYCGFGRLGPEALPQIVEDHVQAVEIARELGVMA